MDVTQAANHNLTLREALKSVARKGLDLSAVLTTVSTHEAVADTEVIAHCHHIALDGSCLPRLQDFTDEVANWVLEYVIPRKKLMEATSSDPTETRLKNERLRRDAISTFKRVGMSGEQGELLMFVLAEAFLELPQLLCKMDLKTDPEVHFHGIDGVHCGTAADDDERLAIYWCESKVHKDLEGALSEAFDGLKDFLITPGTGGKDKKRELALLDRYMDLGSTDLQHKVLEAITPHNAAFNSVKWCGLCLVGFDHEYPLKPNQKSQAVFFDEIKAAFPAWAKMAKSRAKYRNLETFEIHVFYVPFGFCEDFRECMSTSLGLK